MKHYILEVITACSDQQHGQDAVEYAIYMGNVRLCGDKEQDVQNIMRQYDDIVEHYQRELRRNEALLTESYGPLFEEIAGRRVA